MVYDSRPDTLNHINRVQGLLFESGLNINLRAEVHDVTKLDGIEKEAYDELGERQHDITYGSEEYKAQFQAPKMREAIAHHYAHNRHHPEHWPNGVNDMSLFDVLEMLADWKAASERHADGDIWASFEINQERFGLSDQLVAILKNTAREMGW